MDKYTEMAFLVIVLGILVNSGIIAMRMTEIQRKLEIWYKEWRMLQKKEGRDE